MVDKIIYESAIKIANERFNFAAPSLAGICEILADFRERVLSSVDKDRPLLGGGRMAPLVTFSGRRVYPLDPRPGDDLPVIDDVAHALSNICRFAGHVREFYSVAQHSVLVARAASPAARPWALLHDAAEAFFGDLPAPIKVHPLAREYRLREAIFLRDFGKFYGLGWPLPEEVGVLDKRMALAEARDLGVCSRGWYPGIVAWPDKITPWPPELAKVKFMETFGEVICHR